MRFNLLLALALTWAVTGTSYGQLPGVFYSTHDVGRRLGMFDTHSGAFADVGAFGTFDTYGLAFDNIDGKAYTTFNGFSYLTTLAEVDLTTGAITPIGRIGIPMFAIEVGPDGYLYGVGYYNGGLYRISKTTGQATYVGYTGVRFTMDLAFDSEGTLWSTVNNNFYTIDTNTGWTSYQFTAYGTIGGSIMGIAFDKQDKLFATAYAISSPLYKVDMETGMASPSGDATSYGPHGGDIFIRQGAEVIQGGNCYLPGINADGDLASSLGGVGTNTRVINNANKVTLVCQVDVQNLSGKAAVFNDTEGLYCTIVVSGTRYISNDFVLTVSESGQASLRCTYTK